MKRILLLSMIGAAAISSAQVGWVSDAAGVLSLSESIVDNGNGTWTYNYTMTNMGEALPIWWVVVYTNAAVDGSYTSFSDGSHLGWDGFSGTPASDIDSPEGQTNCAYNFSAADAWPGSAPNGIHMGETVSGFSYTATSYDGSAKRFVADREGDWVSNLGFNVGTDDQMFSYGGMTGVVPEPASAAALAIGALGFLAKRRRK